VALAAALGSSALADVITQWNFEMKDFAASTGTGLAALVGGTTYSWASGGISNFALNTTTYAAQGTGDRTRGVQFSGSTAGYNSITLAWNERHSNTSANTVAVFATADGTNWTEVQVFTFTPAATGTGDSWFQRSVTLSSTYANAANFGFRVLAAFNPGPGAASYLASRSTSTYSTAGTLRYDDVTISGNLLPAPGAAALVGLAGLIARRRRA
jgi:hypothetical protein